MRFKKNYKIKSKYNLNLYDYISNLVSILLLYPDCIEHIKIICNIY